jgi:dihydropteroate synthase
VKQSGLRARVLASVAGDEVVAEMAARRADRDLMATVLGRGLRRAMLVGPLPLAEAQAVRQAAQEVGAVAVMARAAGRLDPSRADLLVMGTMDELAAAAAAVQGEVGERMELARRNFAAPVGRTLRCQDRELRLGQKTLIMGIVNVTPDSFSGDGLGVNAEAAIAQGSQMAEEGADMLDVGGESTRPGSEPVGEEEELGRVLPVVEGLAAELDVPISIDSYKSAVVRAALAKGASIVNDISGLHADEAVAQAAADAGAALVVMHIQGTPRDMQKDPKYADVIGVIGEYLEEGIAVARAAGVGEDQIVVDPGIGFGKTLEHNLEILRRLRELRSLGYPVMVGTSRKSMIGTILDLPVGERVEGTAATVALAVAAGADIVRVHDVKEMARVARVADAVVRLEHKLAESAEA